MATGTGAGLLDRAKPPSVYKHAILERYMIQFATMTTKRLSPRRCTLVDAFAGRGRQANGSPASGEQMMLAAKKAAGYKEPVGISIFLVEQSKTDYAVLEKVADEHRRWGLDIEARQGDCADYIPDIEKMADGSSLFLFVDPCGALLPWQTLVNLLERRGKWPRTEALMNFSADFTRRTCGQLYKGQHEYGAIARLDQVCGGTWWHELAIDTYNSTGRINWGASANAIADEYARRLAGAAGGMFWSTSAVRRDLHVQPVYHLVFLTHDETGLWVMNDAAAIARREWVEEVGPDADAETGMLLPMFTVDEYVRRERDASVSAVQANLRRVLADGQPKAVVRHATDIFDGVYGLATEAHFSEAVRKMVTAGEVEFVKKASRPRLHVLRKAPERSE